MSNWSNVSVGDDFRAHVWSAGDGKPLVFLHGFEGHTGEAPFLLRLAEKHRVIAPEHPGYGDSTGIEQIDGILDLALYYRRLFETLELEHIDLVGHSLGGMFAAEIAAICPQLVRRLVLVAPLGLWLDELPIPDTFVMSAGALGRAMWHNPEAPVVTQAMELLADGRTGITATVTRAGNLSSAGKFMWPIPDRGLVKRLPLISAPTLIVAGASDGIVARPYVEAFRSAIPGSRLETIDGAGHLPMIERPEEFLQTVEPFLAG